MSHQQVPQQGHASQYYQQQGHSQQFQAQPGQVPPQHAHRLSQPSHLPLQQGAYAQTPPMNFGASPPMQQGGYGQTSPQHFGSPPASAYGQSFPAPGSGPVQAYYPPTPASPGYDMNLRSHRNLHTEADQLRKAITGLTVDNDTLINVLTKLGPLEIRLLSDVYRLKDGSDLQVDLAAKTTGNFRSTITGLAAGPLLQDVYLIKEAYDARKSHREAILADVLLGRSNADMQAIKSEYEKTFTQKLHVDVAAMVKDDMRMLYDMVINRPRVEDSVPVMKHDIDNDVEALHQAVVKKEGITILCTILSTRSDGQLRGISHEYNQKYKRKLEDAIHACTHGHLRDALLLIIGRATDRALTDATGMEAAMAGLGTKDTLLLNRVIRTHWDRAHMDQVKRAYAATFTKYKSLVKRVKSDTSGSYEKALVACIE